MWDQSDFSIMAARKMAYGLVPRHWFSSGIFLLKNSENSDE
jgi:hypothetical protein